MHFLRDFNHYTRTISCSFFDTIKDFLGLVSFEEGFLSPLPEIVELRLRPLPASSGQIRRIN